MTVFPGSLDYLYYNGVLDHIPYEAYEMVPFQPNYVQSSGMPQLGSIKQSVLGNQGMINTNNSNYLDTAMKGQMYGYYGNSNDYFVGSNYGQNGSNQQAMQMYGGSYYGGGVNNGNYASGMNYAAAGNPYSVNGYGAIPNSYPSSAPYGNYSAGTIPDNGIYNQYDRRIKYVNGDGFRDFITSQTQDIKKGVLNSSPLLKGLLAAAIVIATPILIFRGKKSSSANPSKFKNFWSKINPANWFRGKFDLSKLNPKNWSRIKIDWSKLNPKNWFGGKIDWSKCNPKNWFKGSRTSKIDWSKLNPKNWFKKKP
jgi:hypothetical protein